VIKTKTLKNGKNSRFARGEDKKGKSNYHNRGKLLQDKFICFQRRKSMRVYAYFDIFMSVRLISTESGVIL